MPKAKEIKTDYKEDSCPNCNDTGVYEDEGEGKTCPCQALKE